jgi:UDP-glucose 4-epimerase
MNNLLLGGSGFIGSHIGRKLLAQGDQVTSISRSIGGVSPGVNSIALDFASDRCPQKVLESSDAILILLGQTYKDFDIKKEEQIITNLARQLQSTRARVFYFSTVMVYGDTAAPAAEIAPLQPQDSYGKYKVTAEEILRNTLEAKRLTILRLANIYGSKGNKGFIGLLLNKIQEERPFIQLNGNGQQTRDYVFIDDLVNALVTIINAPGSFGTVNIATGKSYSLIETIDLVSEVTGKKIEYHITHRSVDEPQNSHIDNRTLRDVYGYDRFLSLGEGLAKTVKRYNC